VREHPDIATVERVVGQREGKVYVDFGQNRRGATVVPPYVVRPVPGATVSTPLDWDELEGDLDPGAFTIRTVPQRLSRVGDLFAPVLSDRQDLTPAISKLRDWLG
jgi:bifunctional non-homologous end joining protein LigD